MTKESIALFWSGGKDSAMALHTMNSQGIFPSFLVTTVNKRFDRVSMHGIRSGLLRAQAGRTGIPLHIMEVEEGTNAEYEKVLAATLEFLSLREIGTIAFGDIFLEDLRAYREKQLAKAGMKAVFPLWGRNTHELSGEIIASGIKARICCLDTSKADPSWAGREYDHLFLDSLPESTDPCGENGEFHTFCYDAPFFSSPLTICNGENKAVELPAPSGTGTPLRLVFTDMLPSGS